jgi:3-oxoacyl-[acyl-carrier-protein] synthase-3
VGPTPRPGGMPPTFGDIDELAVKPESEMSLVLSTPTRSGRESPTPPGTASVLGLGHYLPAEVLPNAPIAERIGVDHDWIVKRTGIRSRRRAAPHERLAEIAARAGRASLEDAGVDPIDVDLVLVATLSQDNLMPNAAPVVAQALGADRAGAIDVGAACTGWLSGVSLAAAQLEAGRVDRVLVIGAEILTRLTNYDDPKTAALWGDGAGAVLLGSDGDGAIGPIALAADGALADVIVASHEDRVLRVEGHETFQNAVKRLSESTLTALARAGLALEDIDLFVYHQANARILRAVAERLELAPEKVANYIAETGNTSAASIPLTLALLREDGRLRSGQMILVAAIGAGFTWGAGTIEWGLANNDRRETNIPTTTVTPEAVEKTLRDAMQQFDVDPSEISREATFEELDVDSLDLAEISQIVEEEYGVQLKGEDMKSIRTVGDAIDLVVSQAG